MALTLLTLHVSDSQHDISIQLRGTNYETELVAHNKTRDEIAKHIGADEVG